MMDEALLAALLIGWAAVLLPSALRSRRETDPHTSVGGFTHAMSVLRGRPDGREIMVPERAGQIVSHGARSPQHALLVRRRQVFTRLLGATLGTFLLALVVGGLLWPLFFTTALALFGYVALLRHHKVERDLARHVVRTIDRTIDLAAYEQEPSVDFERVPLAVGAERWGHAEGSLQVVTRPDTPWEPQSSVRIRRWDG
jgi:hypothetical protein